MNIGDTLRSLTETTINIHCQVSGLPKPDITWLRNGQPLIPSADLVIHKNFTLTVKGSTTADSGKYICSARNKAGQESASSNVEVVGKYFIKKVLYNAFSKNTACHSFVNDHHHYHHHSLRTKCHIGH